MTTSQKETIPVIQNNEPKKKDSQQKTRSKKNKKMLVYTPETKNEVKQQKTECEELKKDKNDSSKQNQNTNKNKKQFVYNPEKEEKKTNDNVNKKNNRNQKSRKYIQSNQNQTKSENKVNEKEYNKANQPNEKASKKNKKQFVYIPEKEEKKSVDNQNTSKLVENSPVLNQPNKIQDKSENKHNEKQNQKQKENNSKNNKKQFVYVPKTKETDLTALNEQKEPIANTNDKIIYTTKNNNKKINQKHINFYDKETVNYSTYIELDMHGSDPRAKRPLEWVPVIRDALFSALEKNVDYARFIPGKGLHSNPEIGPILRILVILTSKRLGFESIINPNNEGVIICKVSNQNRNSSIVPHMPNREEQDDLNHNDTLLKAFGMKTGDSLNIDNLSFQAVKARFPHMPTICIAIICAKRTPKEAIEFAQLFEDMLRADNDSEISKEKKSKELLNEIKMIESLEKKYGFDQEIIERVVREKRKEKKSQIILDRISSEIPEDFFSYLTEFLLNFSHVPIETLLDSMKEGLYNPNEITKILNSKSWRGMQNALSVMKVENQITTERNDGRPKFIPTIEIDLKNTPSEKAQMTIDKIMNGLGNGNFSEMVLLLSPKGKKSNKCTINDVSILLYKKSNQEGFHIIRTKRADEKNNRYHFVVFNCKDEM